MDKKLTDKQQKLIIVNFKLLDNFIEKTIKGDVIPERLEDDFISDMYLKFCFSALKYNVKTGFNFSTYVYYGFWLGIRDIVGVKKKKFERTEYISKIDDDYLNECGLNNEIESSLQIGEMDHFIDGVELTAKERSMLDDYYYNKISFSKLGRKYDMSKEGARLIIKSVLEKLQKKAEEQCVEFEDFYV